MTLLTVLLLFFFGADVAVVPKPQGEDLDDQTPKRISSDSPFSKRPPPPSLFGTVSSAGERIHQSCLYPVSVLSLDFGGSHRVWQIPNSPIRGNQAELKATTEEERMDYFCKARPPNFFSPLPFPAFPGIRLILEVGVVALGAWRQEVFFSIHDPLSRRYT